MTGDTTGDTTGRTGQLIREAFAAEADQAPDSRAILAELSRARPPRRRTALVAATVAVVAVALAAVAVPTLLHRNTPAAGPQDQDVLLLGLDRSKKTELLMLAHLDGDGTASVVSLPDIMPRGDGSTYALNEVYRAFGPDRLLQDVAKLTGVRVEHYAALDLDAFGDLAAAVGGVPVCLRKATKDPDSGVSFPAGTHTITGAKVLPFIRQKDDVRPYRDDDTVPYPYFVQRQEAFLTGLASKAGDADPEAVLDVLGKHLRTDGELDVLGLAERIATAKGVRFIEVDAGLDMPMDTGRGGTVIPLVPVRAFVQDMFAGKAHPGGPRTPELKFSKQRCVY
ncbi:MAG TPA: LCP family protein [Actinophytocola sp.]|uniref:LCP family protein n=1 Tax=Actinophytocola sp. TaxID=1872138 RepID=UPI002F94B2D0